MDPMVSNKKKEWKFQNASEKTIGIHDAIHGPILIHHPIAKIVDTPAFQRLRFIKQLGLCQYVFPSAQHDRFTHSLGVYHLALEVVRNLADKDENDSLGITSTDKLCVAIAGLLHDLGHGPFSHFYDGLFLKNMGVQGFVHEQMSCKIFDYIYEEEPGLRATLDEYLDETDRIFIKELIDTPKNLVDSKGEWVPKGRPREKAFLFQIVNDPISGFDVDKIDYLLRDSKMANVSIRLSKDNWSHVINSMRVEVPKDSKFPQIIFENKREIMVEDVFEERLRLHKTVYRHKSTLAMEIAMCEVLMKANEHLKFEGSDGEFYKMTEAFNNVVAFLKMDDHIIKMIQIGADKNPDIVEAKKLLVKIQRRELPKLAYRLDLKPSMESDMKRTKHQIESDLKQKLQDLKQSDLTSHIFVRLVAFHQGRGVNKSALENVRFNSTVENEGKNSGGSLHAFIYVSYEKRELKDEVLKAIKCLRQTGERPKYLKESVKSEGIGKDVKDVSEGRGKKRTLQESNECNQPTLTEEAQNNSLELSSSFEDVNEGGGMEN